MTISISVHTGIFNQERHQWTSVTPPPSNSSPCWSPFQQRNPS